MDVLLPLLLSGLCGAALSLFELVETFGRWVGRLWRSRWMLALVALNTATAAGVYAFLHYALGVKSEFWLAAVTGLTFPAILRSNFTFYRALRQREGSNGGLSLRVHDWYCRLEELCYQEANGHIADARARLLMDIGRWLSEHEILAILTAHIAAEMLLDSRKRHLLKLKAIQQVADPGERLLRLAALLMETLPEERLRVLLAGCRRRHAARRPLLPQT